MKGADLSSITSRIVRQQLESKLGVDLSSRKEEIEKIIMADVEDKVESSEEEVSEDEGKDSDSDTGAKKKPKAAPKRKKTEEEDDDWGSKKKAVSIY